MAKCDLHFLLFAAIVCAAVAAEEEALPEAPPNVVEACTKAAKIDNLINFCAQVFLKDKAAELTDVNDWEKMSRVAITQGAATATAIEKTVADLANDQSLSYYDRATLNLCLQSVKRGAEQISEAAAAFEKMEKISEDGLKEVQILMDNGKSNQGKCENLLESQASLLDVWQQVHDAFLATRIVTRFLFHVRPY